MAFNKITTVLGCPIQYQLDPSVKKYTLKDNGFKETSSGNFQLIMPLDPTPQSKQGFKLKVTVTKALDGIKMSVTTANGMKAVNIFENSRDEGSKEKFYFLMDGMIGRGVFQKVEK